MPRCNCSSASRCSCNIEGSDGNCIDVVVTGQGTLADKFIVTATPNVSIAAGNQLTCGAGGFFVPTPADAGGDAFMTVASSDTPAILADHADFVCDGTDDHIEIQAAITALNAGGFGGKIYLLPGIFFVGATINIGFGQSLIGSGMGSTIIDTYVGPVFNLPGTDGNVFSDFKVTTNDDYRVFTGTGTEGGTSPIVIERVHVDGSLTNISSCVVTGQSYIIRDCVFDWGGVAIDIRSGGDGQRIESNHFKFGSILVGNIQWVIISNNTFEDTIGGNAYIAAQPWGPAVDSSAIILFSGCNSCRLINNIIDNPGNHGIALIGEPGTSTGGPGFCTVTDNTIIEPSGYGIFLDDDASNNNIKDNFIYGGGGGISIDEASCTDNWVTNNDLSMVSGTAFNDAGTGTIVTAGNRL